MTVLKSETVPVQNSDDVVRVRQIVRTWAANLGFGLVDQTKIVTATSELARNMVLAAGQGVVILESLQTTRVGLRLTFEDKGPGIPDIEKVMQDGYTTWGGMGLGLSGSKRLMDDFEIYSEVGVGTQVRVTKWK